MSDDKSKPNKAGRKPLPEGERLDTAIQVRTTQAQKTAFLAMPDNSRRMRKALERELAKDARAERAS